HNLWDVIVNEDLEEEPAPTTGETFAPPAPKTAKQLVARTNQERVKSILLLAIPYEYLLKFHNNQIALIMRNKPDIDEIDIDNLYNNLRVYEDELKSTASGDFEMDRDDLEELDLRWQVAMLTSKIKCYNYHRKGHFARECRSRRNQGRRSYGDNVRSNAPITESSSQALVAQDGLESYD
ncbi:ribonuclease H-like domain-containing protein, partial [Tanacetum coccineum]